MRITPPLLSPAASELCFARFGHQGFASQHQSLNNVVCQKKSGQQAERRGRMKELQPPVPGERRYSRAPPAEKSPQCSKSSAIKS